MEYKTSNMAAEKSHNVTLLSSGALETWRLHNYAIKGDNINEW